MPPDAPKTEAAPIPYAWIPTSERLPPYGKWTLIRIASGIVPGYRSHTDGQGEHWLSSVMSLGKRLDSLDLINIQVSAWLEYPED